MDTTQEIGTQADVARALGISRQAVNKLVKNRARTGMPEAEPDGRFDIARVRDWYATFEPRRGPMKGSRKLS